MPTTYNVSTTLGHREIVADRYREDKETRDLYFYNGTSRDRDPVDHVNGQHWVRCRPEAGG